MFVIKSVFSLSIHCFNRYVEIAKLLIESGSKIDFREPTDELYPRTMLSDEPLRLAFKNRNYVSYFILLFAYLREPTTFIPIKCSIFDSRKWQDCFWKMELIRTNDTF